MNEHVKPPASRLPLPRRRPPTRAAEGLPRWRWTTAELERVAATGIFNGQDDFELIGGEMVPMSPSGRRHDLVREEVEEALRNQASPEVKVVGEMQLNLAEDTYTKPDVLVRPATIKSPDLRGDTVLLVVEVADSSLETDLDTKARQYATYGVREYWVVEAWPLTVHVHRQPEPAAGIYRSIERVPPSEARSLLLAPSISVRMADLGL